MCNPVLKLIVHVAQLLKTASAHASAMRDIPTTTADVPTLQFHVSESMARFALAVESVCVELVFVTKPLVLVDLLAVTVLA